MQNCCFGKLACVYAPGVVALAAGSQLRLGFVAVHWCLTESYELGVSGVVFPPWVAREVLACFVYYWHTSRRLHLCVWLARVCGYSIAYCLRLF
jgi:hypothetical protein